MGQLVIQREKIKIKNYIHSKDSIIEITEGIKLIYDILKQLDSNPNLIIILVFFDEKTSDNAYVDGKNFKIIFSLLERYLAKDVLKRRIKLQNTEKNLFLYQYLYKS